MFDKKYGKVTPRSRSGDFRQLREDFEEKGDREVNEDLEPPESGADNDDQLCPERTGVKGRDQRR